MPPAACATGLVTCFASNLIPIGSKAPGMFRIGVWVVSSGQHLTACCFPGVAMRRSLTGYTSAQSSLFLLSVCKNSVLETGGGAISFLPSFSSGWSYEMVLGLPNLPEGHCVRRRTGAGGTAREGAFSVPWNLFLLSFWYRNMESCGSGVFPEGTLSQPNGLVTTKELSALSPTRSTRPLHGSLGLSLFSDQFLRLQDHGLRSEWCDTHH